jgi:hypothetical protein
MLWVNVLHILSILILAIIFVQDICNRSIHFSLPILLFIFGLIFNYYVLEMGHNWMYNLCFVVVNIIGVIIYFSVKNKKVSNPIDVAIGWGDIVFFIAITPFFLFKTFMLFFTASLIFSLACFYIIRLFKNIKTIPLAGYMSLFFVLNFIGDHFFKTSIYQWI